MATPTESKATPTESKVLTGSCACHHISYTTTQLPMDVTNCHCNSCRKQSGAPYQSWATFATGTITWAVPPTFRRSSDIATRSFCPRCGSSITMEYDFEPGQLSITAGTIDDEQCTKIPKPSAHIFLQEKAAWFDLPEDQAERWEGFPPSLVEELRRLHRNSD